MFDAGKTRVIGLPYGKKNYDDMLSRFHTGTLQTDGQTDLLDEYRVSMLTRDKNCYVLFRSVVNLALMNDRF